MTDSQIKEINSVLTEWWKYCRPRTLLSEDHNFTEVFEAVVEDAKSHDGKVDVADVTRVVCGLGDIDRGGRLRYHKPPVVEAASQGNNVIPWADEALLRTIISMRAVRDLTSGELKTLCSRHPYDHQGNEIVPISRKFEERVAWLKAHPDISPDAIAEAINCVLDGNKPKQQLKTVVFKRVEDPRVTAIREQIERESKGYTGYAHRKGERLNAMLNELLRDPSLQVYRDRSRGGVETLRGLDAVEKIMNEKIRDYESPFK